MSKLDDAIHQQLSKEDAEFLAKFEKEPSSAAQMLGIFAGPFAWVSYIFMAAAVVVGITLVFAVWKFIVTEDLRAMIQWGGLALFGLLVMVTIRLWFWMEIQSNRVVREIRVLQLQIARSAARE